MNNPITQSTDETCNIVQDLLPLYYDNAVPQAKGLLKNTLRLVKNVKIHTMS